MFHSSQNEKFNCNYTFDDKSSIFDSKIFMKKFQTFINKRQYGNIRTLRKMIQRQTLNAIKSNYYEKGYVVKGKRKKMKKTIILCKEECFKNQVRNTKMYKKIKLSKIKASQRYKEKVVVEVVNGDCLEEGLKLVSQGFNPAVLNMASASCAGGAFSAGAGAQEENMFRRTTLYNAFYNPFGFKDVKPVKYPIPLIGGVHSSKILVFRGSEKKGYPFLDSPIPIDVIAMPAQQYPRTMTLKKSKFKEFKFPGTRNQMFTPTTEKIALEKIRSIFKIAKDQGNDSLVLSALGCGAYRNPTGHTAVLFKKAIDEFKYDFKRIVFAILEDHNSPATGNLKPFELVFSDDSDFNSQKTISSGTIDDSDIDMEEKNNRIQFSNVLEQIKKK